jgi:hypothetical protein
MDANTLIEIKELRKEVNEVKEMLKWMAKGLAGAHCLRFEQADASQNSKEMSSIFTDVPIETKSYLKEAN